MIAPAAHSGFPFPIADATGLWDGSDYSADQSKVCGPGTRYPQGMTIQQMAQLYWRAKSYKLTASCTASSYSVADYSTAFADMTWPELDTPESSGWEYYQINAVSADSPQPYPAAQPDNDTPWMIVVPVYQIFDTDSIAATSIPSDGSSMRGANGTGFMTQSATAWMLRLFQYGALKIGTTYYPSIELSLVPPLDGGPLGTVSLSSYEGASA
jgi:hypothetical protein